MGRVRYYCASTLDGFIAESDDTIDWLTGYEPVGGYAGASEEEATMPDAYERFYADIGALVSGSVTYEFVARQLENGTEWPYAGKPCWVLTSRHLPVIEGDEVDIRFVRGDVRDLCDDMMRSAAGKDLWVVGGGNLASQFADNRLLDEVVVTVVPVALGRGKPLFDRRVPDGPLALTGVRPFANGMVQLTYEIPGAGL
jgi:dihydrofolate reductase